MKITTDLLFHFTQLLFEGKFFHTKVVEEIETHILCSVTFIFFFENRAVYEII